MQKQKEGCGMVVSVFKEHPVLEDGYIAGHGTTWYVCTGKHKILLDMGDAKEFLKAAGQLGIDVGEVDVIVIPLGCKDPIREVERLIAVNEDAKIYIPKKTCERYFHGISGRLSMYGGCRNGMEWMERVVFMEPDVVIDEEIQLFVSGMGRSPYELQEEQSVLLYEEGKSVLFLNDENQDKENILKKAEEVAGQPVSFIFSSLSSFAAGKKAAGLKSEISII